MVPTNFDFCLMADLKMWSQKYFFKTIQNSLLFDLNLSSGTLFRWKKYLTLLMLLYYYIWNLWFRYRFRYLPKVLANYSFGFGIGPKPKWWFRSFTNCKKWKSPSWKLRTYRKVASKVIIEKSCDGRFLWNRNWDLGWIWAKWPIFLPS